MIKQKRRTTGDTVAFVAGWILFIIYLLALSYFLFFSERYGRTGTISEYRYNLVLFTEIRRFLTYRYELGWKTVVINLVGNVAAFLPFGFILPIIIRKKTNLLELVVLSFAFSLVIETLQLVFRVGIFDVDDLLLNTLGGLIGYIAFCVIRPVKRK